MRLLVDGHFLDGKKHGVAIYLDRLYSKYHSLYAEDELHIGLEPDSDANHQLFALPGVYVHRYRVGGVLRFLYDIPRLARQINADLVHTQYVAPLRIGYSAKRHVTLHDVLYEDFPHLFSPIYRWSRKIIFGWSAKRADLVTTISKYSRSRISALYKIPVRKIHVVYPGVVEDSSYTEVSLNIKKSSTILYVSRFEKRKNHLALLKSLKELLLSHPDLRVILVGFDIDGTLTQLREYISINGLNDAVEIRSQISDAELYSLYTTSGVVVYPSFGEGFGMPIIESFLLNPNTLFSNRTAMAEFTFAPENTFDPYNGDAITAKIRLALRACNTPQLEWQAQRRKVIEKYNWCRSAQVLFQLYHECETKNLFFPPPEDEL